MPSESPLERRKDFNISAKQYSHDSENYKVILCVDKITNSSIMLDDNAINILITFTNMPLHIIGDFIWLINYATEPIAQSNEHK